MNKPFAWIDQDTKKLVLEYDNNFLLEKYYHNFINLVKSRVQIDSVTKTDNKIKFNCPLDLKIGEKVWNIYTQFISMACDYEKKRVEFISIQSPISIQDDEINRILKEKKDIILVDEFKDDYSDGSFNQYLVDYTNEDEYTDIILAMKNNNINEIKEKYQDKLKLVYWF